MAATVSYDDVQVGDELPSLSVTVRRDDLVRYAGASGDFNPIHWNERIARSVELPNVIAHGMFTMAQAVRVITDWVGDPTAVVDYSVRFARPVVVPDDEKGATVEASGRIAAKLEDRRVRVDLLVTCADEKVLSRPRAIVQLT